MANPTSAEVGAARAVATGAISWAPLGTALPTDATTALNAAFKGLGYVGEEGITPTREVSTSDVKDMNGDSVAVLQEDFNRMYQATLIQADNVDIKNMIFGAANVTVTAGSPTNGARIAVVDKGEPCAHGELVVDLYRIGSTGVTAKHREVAADAQPISVEYGPYVATAVRQYTVQWKVFKVSGTFVTEYDDDGVLVP